MQILRQNGKASWDVSPLWLLSKIASPRAAGSQRPRPVDMRLKLYLTRRYIEDLLQEHPDRIKKAGAYGVKSVPALVIEDQTFYINYGASIDDLKH